jgi:hypothetical protein
MKRQMFVWLAVCAGFVLVLSATDAPGWVLGLLVAASLMLGIPLSVKRHRQERNFIRTAWRALRTR